MLWQRIVTAVVLLALLVPALFAPLDWPFNLLTLLLIAAAGWEWARLNQVGMPASLGMGLALASACAAALAAGAGSSLRAADSALHFRSGPKQTALVELFTSEGCSSCPPAEAWLNRLGARPGLWSEFVPVALHVNYWDHLGWRDPWAAREFTARQRSYAAAWNSRTIYTPGMVLNGQEWRTWARNDAVPPPRTAAGSVEYGCAHRLRGGELPEKRINRGDAEVAEKTEELEERGETFRYVVRENSLSLPRP